MKSKSSVWEHFKEININNGLGRPMTKKYQCKYCKELFGPCNATKKKTHIINCNFSPQDIKKLFKGIKKKREPDDEEEYQIEMDIIDNNVTSTNDTNKTDKECESQDKKGSAKGFFDTMSAEQQKKASSLFSKALYVTACGLTLFTHPLWGALFSFLRPAFKLPGKYALSNGLLNNEYLATKTIVDVRIKETKTKHLQCDGWSNIKNEGLINFLISSPKPLFVKFVNTKTNRHTAEYLRDVIESVLLEYGVKDFFGIIGDNAKNIQKALWYLTLKYPHLIQLGCVAHALHLLCSDIIKIPSFTQFLGTVKNIVKVIKKSTILSGIFIDIKSKENINSQVQLPGKTRWGSHVFMLRSVIKCRPALKKLVVDERSNDVILEHPELRDLLNNNFWLSIELLLDILSPIVDLIYEIEGDDPGIWKVIPSINTMINQMNLNLKKIALTENENAVIFMKIKERKSMIIQPIHYAAVLLNPNNQGKDFSDEELEKAYCFISTTCKNMDVESGDVMMDIIGYKNRSGKWGKSYYWNLAKKIDPREWWKALHPNKDLSKVAQRILGAPVTSAATERANSMFSRQHSKERNQLDPERAGKLTFIAQNWNLLNAEKRNDKKKPLKALVDIEITEQDLQQREKEKNKEKENDEEGEKDVVEIISEENERVSVFNFDLFDQDFVFDVDALDCEDEELAEEYKEEWSQEDMFLEEQNDTEMDPNPAMKTEMYIPVQKETRVNNTQIDLNALPIDFLLRNSTLDQATGMRKILLNGVEYKFTLKN